MFLTADNSFVVSSSTDKTVRGRSNSSITSRDEYCMYQRSFQIALRTYLIMFFVFSFLCYFFHKICMWFLMGFSDVAYFCDHSLIL